VGAKGPRYTRSATKATKRKRVAKGEKCSCGRRETGPMCGDVGKRVGKKCVEKRGKAHYKKGASYRPQNSVEKGFGVWGGG